MSEISRRQLLGGAAKLSVAGGALALAGGTLVSACSDENAGAASDVVPYTGVRQAGIVTPVQGRLVYGAFDVKTKRHTDLQKMLRAWTDAIGALTAGRPVGEVE